jgi:hypothetical protein
LKANAAFVRHRPPLLLQLSSATVTDVAAAAAAATSHLSKGVIHPADSGDENVGSDVEEVVQWDRSLRSTKTFQTVVLILSGVSLSPQTSNRS